MPAARRATGGEERTITGGGGGQEPADEKWMSGGESPGPWRKPPGLRIRGVEQLNETASPRGEVESIRT
jgi:hypothetical protein